MAKRIEPFVIDQEEIEGHDTGRCLACRAEAHGVEPDARAYECESCGARRVYGCEELLIMGLVQLSEGEGG